MTAPAGELRLYGYFRSTSAWRVRIALAWKGVPHRIVPVHLLGGEQHADEFVARNPLKQVPVLEVDGPNGTFALTQSLAPRNWFPA